MELFQESENFIQPFGDAMLICQLISAIKESGLKKKKVNNSWQN